MTTPLRVVDLLAALVGRLGVDPPHFRAILTLQLMLDRRRQHGWVQGTRRITPLTWSLIVHGVMGLALAALPLLVPSPMTAITLGLSVVMAMLAFDLVADYSALLLAPTETALLAARPVAPRTVLAARLAHVGTYLAMYAGVLAAGTCVAGTVRWGMPFLPAYLVSVLGTAVFVLAAVTIVYLAIMRVVSLERLRDATMWAQLAMTALTVLAYYAVSVVDLRTGPGIEDRAWIWFYPPAWMGGLPTLAAGRRDGLVIGLAALGLVVPGVLAVAAIRLASAFRAAGSGAAAPRRERSLRRGSLGSRLARWTTTSAAARGVFELVWILTARDRHFKTRVYPPLLAIVLFVVAVAILVQTGAWDDRIDEITRTNLHLPFLYYGILVIPTPILMVPFTDRPEAAWIQRALPIDRAGTVIVAGLVALCVRFVVPVFTSIAVVVVVVWGWRASADVALAFAATLLVTFRFAVAAGRRLPFSLPPPGGGTGTTAGAVFGGMVLVLALGAVHWLLRQPVLPLPQPWPVIAAIPVVLALAGVAAWTCATTEWRDRSAGGGPTAWS